MSNIKKLMVSAAGGGGLDVDDVFSTYLWNFGSGTLTVNNGIDLSGEGGLVWVKGRNSNYHWLHDSERTLSSALHTNTADGPTTNTNSITALNSNGFTVGGTHSGSVDHASWTFRKAPKFFDIVTYTGNGVGDDRTISHNLGSTPGMIIVKRTNGSGDWYVYHRGLNISGAAPEDQFLTLNSSYGSGNSPWAWNDTAPTDTGFTVKTAISNVNGANYVAYLFAHHNNDGEFGPNGDQDIIKCGSYTGAAASGVTINLGFEPQFVIIKKTNSSALWTVIDTMRGMPSEGNSNVLYPNTSQAEANPQSNAKVYPTPTGLYIEDDATEINTNNGSYIYMAIRRGPLAVPEDATKVFDVVSQTPSSNLSGTDVASSTGVVDFISTKVRNASGIGDWGQWDRLRGGKRLRTNSTAAESDFGATYNFFLDYSDGVLDNFYYPQGTVTSPVVYHMWKRAPGFFDVVAYTGSATSGNNYAGQTLNHNLGVAPEMMWVKRRQNAGGWVVYHKGLNVNGDNAPETDYISLTDNGIAADFYGYWDDTAPTSTEFTLGSNNGVNNGNETYIAYLFASAPGVSKVGSYSGDGNNGRVIDCGFSSGARFILHKCTSHAGSWFLFDSERGIVSGNDPRLWLNATDAEVTNGDFIDPHSSGFIVNNAFGDLNDSGRDYIFYAIA